MMNRKFENRIREIHYYLTAQIREEIDHLESPAQADNEPAQEDHVSLSPIEVIRKSVSIASTEERVYRQARSLTPPGRRTKAMECFGQRYGRLTVFRPCGHDSSRRAVVLCRCDCGVWLVRRYDALTSPRGTRSCGCASKDRSLYGKEIRLHLAGAVKAYGLELAQRERKPITVNESLKSVIRTQEIIEAELKQAGFVFTAKEKNETDNQEALPVSSTEELTPKSNPFMDALNSMIKISHTKESSNENDI
jgi:hypothetical protein